MDNQFTLESVEAQFKDGKIIGAEMKSPYHGMRRVRFFCANGMFCYFAKGSSRNGYYVGSGVIENIARLLPKPLQKDQDTQTFNLLQKYRKMAQKASFLNGFIQDCLNLPNTMEQWIADGKKTPYKYSITTGTRIDGRVISLEAIAKHNQYGVDGFRSAILKSEPYQTRHFAFRGYEASLGCHRDALGMMGTLAVEFKGCGNGYYYLLINDDNFIGYDVD